jgi:hypothetical protein
MKAPRRKSKVPEKIEGASHLRVKSYAVKGLCKGLSFDRLRKHGSENSKLGLLGLFDSAKILQNTCFVVFECIWKILRGRGAPAKPVRCSE